MHLGCQACNSLASHPLAAVRHDRLYKLHSNPSGSLATIYLKIEDKKYRSYLESFAWKGSSFLLPKEIIFNPTLYIEVRMIKTELLIEHDFCKSTEKTTDIC